MAGSSSSGSDLSLPGLGACLIRLLWMRACEPALQPGLLHPHQTVQPPTLHRQLVDQVDPAELSLRQGPGPPTLHRPLSEQFCRVNPAELLRQGPGLRHLLQPAGATTPMSASPTRHGSPHWVLATMWLVIEHPVGRPVVRCSSGAVDAVDAGRSQPTLLFHPTSLLPSMQTCRLMPPAGGASDSHRGIN